MTTNKSCPTCGGSGNVPVQPWANGKAIDSFKLMDCPACHGTGTVKTHTFQDTIDEVRSVRERQEAYYKQHGHYYYEDCHCEPQEQPEPEAQEATHPTYHVTHQKADGSKEEWDEIDKAVTSIHYGKAFSAHPEPTLTELERPTLVGVLFGEDVYMLSSAHKKLMQTGVLDQSKELAYYVGNPDVTKLLTQTAARMALEAQIGELQQLWEMGVEHGIDNRIAELHDQLNGLGK